jgi:hypothetical protein
MLSVDGEKSKIMSNTKTQLQHITAQTTTLPLLIRSIVVVPQFLPRENLSFDSGKNNGVVCAHVMCNGGGWKRWYKNGILEKYLGDHL